MKTVSYEAIVNNRRPLKAREVPIWKRLAMALARYNVTPNMISCVGMAAGLLSGAALAGTAFVESVLLQRGFWILGGVFILLRSTGNILDGVLAVETRAATPTGALWNEVPDRLSDAATLIGAGYALGGSPTAGWAAALAAVFVAYIRAQSSVAGAPQDFTGPMAKPARMVLVVVSAFYLGITPTAWHPAWGDAAYGLVTLALVTIVAGCVVTAMRRLNRARRYLAGVAS